MLRGDYIMLMMRHMHASYYIIYQHCDVVSSCARQHLLNYCRINLVINIKLSSLLIASFEH